MKVCKVIISSLCVLALVCASIVVPEVSVFPTSAEEALADPATQTSDNSTSDDTKESEDTSSGTSSGSSTSGSSTSGDANAQDVGDAGTSQDEQSALDAQAAAEEQAAAEAAALAAAQEAALAEAQAQELSDEEKLRASKATSLLSSSDSTVSTFGTTSSQLTSAAYELGSVQSEISSLMQQRIAAVLDTFDLNAKARLAQLQLASTEQEISDLGNVDFYALFFGESKIDDLEDYAFDLNKEQSEQDVLSGEADVQASNGTAQVATVDASIEAAEEKVSDVVASGNEAAYTLERADSSSRTDEQEAAEEIEAIDATKPDAVEIASTYTSTCTVNDVSRSVARESLSSWYGTVSNLSGVQSSLIFGTGEDFSMSEEEFVEKWGKAIDTFYDEFATTAGFTPPLKGQGATMAKYAYEYKIDPRLCAAVSIAESSGGQYCIKSCNAWGWGAADSDPAGGAVFWDSWEEAIQAWHQGLAESTTGMATAGSVSALGEIYCSTATWAATVTEQMEKISACAV